MYILCCQARVPAALRPGVSIKPKRLWLGYTYPLYTEQNRSKLKMFQKTRLLSSSSTQSLGGGRYRGDLSTGRSEL
jgi:hypothetical protein